jgi:hypothetical protein
MVVQTAEDWEMAALMAVFRQADLEDLPGGYPVCRGHLVFQSQAGWDLPAFLPARRGMFSLS